MSGTSGELTEKLIVKHIPYERPRSNQLRIVTFVAQSNLRCLVEAPTGSGKTGDEYAILKAAGTIGIRPLWLIVPNKAILQRIRNEFPNITVAFGRNEHPCCYYEDDKKTLGDTGRSFQFKADQIPCASLVNCSHRVNLETGETYEAGAHPCPYLQQRYEARQSKGIVLCTMAFYLFTHLFHGDAEEEGGVVVVDEVHRLPLVVRNCLSSQITDLHLRQAVGLLEKIGASKEAEGVDLFLKKMIHIAKRRPAFSRVNLNDREIGQLLEILEAIDKPKLLKALSDAVREGSVDTKAERETLQQVEVFARDLHRYVTAFTYSLPDEQTNRRALNYIYAFYKTEDKESGGANYRLVVRCYYVPPLINRILPKMTIGMSATIGDRKTFGYVSGMTEKKFPFLSLPSEFPPENSGIFIPTDTPDLGRKNRPHGEPARTMRRVAKICRTLARKGIRALFVVVSNDERERFLALAAEESVKAVSYGNGVTARDAAAAFVSGDGEVLVGTWANYSEGIDLPKRTAPVILALRPAYRPPDDPEVQFEIKRFGKRYTWALTQYWAMLEALQVRGRNIRSETDVGCIIFLSQQFRSFVRKSLPEALRPSYRSDLRLEDEIVPKVIEMVGGKS